LSSHSQDGLLIETPPRTCEQPLSTSLHPPLRISAPASPRAHPHRPPTRPWHASHASASASSEGMGSTQPQLVYVRVTADIETVGGSINLEVEEEAAKKPEVMEKAQWDGLYRAPGSQ